MAMFRISLGAVFAAIAIYTIITGTSHGWNLVPVFFGDMAAMNWPGQFNFDFFTFLLLSGLWLAWRHHFTPAGLLLGIIGVVGGMLFLSAHLLFASIRAKGDIAEIMLGRARASAIGRQ